MIRAACVLLMLVDAMSATAAPPACLPERSGAHLAGADLRLADLRDATIDQADLTGVGRTRTCDP